MGQRIIWTGVVVVGFWSLSAQALSPVEYCQNNSDKPFEIINISAASSASGCIVKACSNGTFLSAVMSQANCQALTTSYNKVQAQCDKQVQDTVPVATGTIESPSAASGLTGLGSFASNNADAVAQLHTDYAALKQALAQLATDTATARLKKTTSNAAAIAAAKAAIAKGGVDQVAITDAKNTLVTDVKPLATQYYTQIEAPWAAAVETCTTGYQTPAQCYLQSWKTLNFDFASIFGDGAISLPMVPTTSASILSTCDGGETKLFNTLVVTSTKGGTTSYKASSKNTTATDSCSIETEKSTPATPAKPSPDLVCRMLGAIGWKN